MAKTNPPIVKDLISVAIYLILLTTYSVVDYVPVLFMMLAYMTGFYKSYF